MLAERNKLKRGELLTGKQYYIWELIHENQVIVSYEDICNLVKGKEENLNQGGGPRKLDNVLSYKSDSDD